MPQKFVKVKMKIQYFIIFKRCQIKKHKNKFRR